jgi:microcystin-dependent protein
MATRVPYPIFKAFTADGTLGIGYKLYTYKAGTTTLLTTYQDEAATIPNTNPIVLDSLGEAEVFITESAKLTLTDPDGAVVPGWPVDNIDPTSVDAASVSFAPTGALTSTNVQDAIEEIAASVADFADMEINISPGLIMAWLASTPPSGFLECDGTAVSRTTYANLFLVISDDYGAGDGTTTFNLPDLRGEFLRGWDHGAGVDPGAATRTNRGDTTTGDNVGTKQAEAYKAHTHGLSNIMTTNSGATSFAYRTDATRAPATATSSSGGAETRPRNINVMWVIKY